MLVLKVSVLVVLLKLLAPGMGWDAVVKVEGVMSDRAVEARSPSFKHSRTYPPRCICGRSDAQRPAPANAAPTDDAGRPQPQRSTCNQHQACRRWAHPFCHVLVDGCGRSVSDLVGGDVEC